VLYWFGVKSNWPRNFTADINSKDAGPGTESVGLAVGLATALELAVSELPARRASVLRLRQLFLERLRDLASPVILNGPEEGGVPHTLNLSFPGCRADSLLMNLDLAGVACSTGSACSSGSLLPSPVLQAMGLPDDVLHSAMRFSFSALLNEGAVGRSGRADCGGCSSFAEGFWRVTQ